MTSRPPDPADLPPLVAAVKERLPGLVGIWLFGSLARHAPRNDSDIDLAVLCQGELDPVPLFDLQLELGVIASRDVDLVDLRRAPLPLRYMVATEGQLLVAIDPVECERFRAASIDLFLAYQEDRHLALRQPRRGA